MRQPLWPLGVGLYLATVTGCRPDSTSPPPPPPPPPGTHVGHYVVPPPYGTRAGNGTNDAPWDLATALDGGRGQVHPGDTVWLRAGTYVGSFRTTLTGTPSAPIVFRQYPGERATIDGSLSAKGSHLWFWGFEIKQSTLHSPDRVLAANTDSGRFINLVLHDAGISGVSMIDNAGAGVELYGSVVYNNGYNDNLDHGIYAHNATDGTKYITDNVFFNNCARGIQVYEAGGTLIRNVAVVGNVSFDNGTLSCLSNRTNLLVSAPATTSGMVVRDNLLYFAPQVHGGWQMLLGNYDTLYNQDIVVENNFAVGGDAGLVMQLQWNQATVRNNELVGNAATDMVAVGGSTFGGYVWTGNVYHRDPNAQAWVQNGTSYDFTNWKAATGLGVGDSAASSAPAATRVFLRPNKYEPGRAFVVVYNFGTEAAVNVDLSTVLAVDATFAIRNVQDIYAPTPVISGIYAGGAIAIPMNGVQPPKPVGRATAAPRTAPSFDVFLVTSETP